MTIQEFGSLGELIGSIATLVTLGLPQVVIEHRGESNDVNPALR